MAAVIAPVRLAPAIAAIVLFALWLVARRRRVAGKLGLGAPEAGLLTLGSLAAGSVVVPVFLVGASVLSINLGGALVPIVLAVALWRRARLGLVAPIGIAAVAVVAWGSVAFVADEGIVADLPWSVLPGLTAAGWGLALLPRGLDRAVAHAYVAGALGVLVGADVLNLGRIVDAARAAADPTALVIGGAGAFDLVFLSGIGALALTAAVGWRFAPTPRRGPASTHRVALVDPAAAAPWAADRPGREAAAIRLWVLADKALLAGGFVQSTRAAADAAAALDEGRSTVASPERTRIAGLAQRATDGESGRTGAVYALDLLGTLAARRIERPEDVPGVMVLPRVDSLPPTAPGHLRALAFGIDLGALALVLLGVAVAASRGDLAGLTRDATRLLTALLFILPVSLLYFTLLEGLGGATAGKAFVGVKVTGPDGLPPGLYRAFVRNTLRLLWGAGLVLGPLFMIADAVLLRWTELDQRLGDLVAGTVVVESA